MKKLTLVLSASLALFCAKSQAHPYASGVTNNAGTITFHLNETVTNGQVYVLFDSGSVSNVPAGIPNNGTNVARGVYSFALGAHTNYSINVFGIGTGSAYQISPNPAAGSVATNFDYFGPRGVAINKNPKSPYFGTVYVSHGSAGTDTLRTTTMGKGIFAIYPDGTDRFGYGNTAMPTGMTYSASTTMSCYRVAIGPDDMIYLADCSSGPNNGTAANNVGNVYMITPDLKTAVGLFPTNATPATIGQYVDAFALNVKGSYAQGTLDLYTLEWDRAPYQNVWRYHFYDINNPGTPLTLPLDANNTFPDSFAASGSCPDIYGYGQNNPNTFVNAGISSFNGVKSDYYMGPDGRFYTVEPRANPTQQSLAMFESETNGACLLYDDSDAVPKDGNGQFTTQTVWWGANSVTVSDDNQFLAVGISSSTAVGQSTNVNNKKILYTTFSGPNHMPVLPPSTITYGSATAPVVAGVAFDIADNLYGVSGSDDSLRVYTMGMTTLTSYSNDTTGTNGNFTLTTPGSSVSVTATQPLASQNHGSPTPGVLTFTRTGTASALSQPLTVNFTLTGTATQAPWNSPASFTANPSSSVTFAANQTTATVNITPSNDNISRPTLTVTANLQGSQVYSVTPPTSATIYIVNTGPQLLMVNNGGATTMYRGSAKDYGTATITRWGDTNANTYTVQAANFTYAGTAQQNVDFTGLVQPFNMAGANNGSADISINPGDVNVTVMVGNPAATANYVGDKTIILGLNSAGGYTAATNKATITILDNHYQNEQIIWSNALTSAADSTNWLVAFGGEAVQTVTYPNYPNYAAGTAPNDFDVEFGYSLANDGVGNSPSGASTGLKITVNKKNSGGTGAKAGVSVYPQGVNLSGDYAVRFNMNLVRGSAATTEYGQFGINHFGTNNLWWAGSGLVAPAYGNINIDGLWYSVTADQGGAAPNAAVGDLMAMAGQPLPNTGWLTARPPQGAGNYANVFKHPAVYSAGADNTYGTPANDTGLDKSSWVDVEIAQSNSIVTLSMNRTVIFTYTNKPTGQGGNTGGGVYTSGTPMLGYCDPFQSSGVDAAMYISNIRAVNLNTTPIAPKITNVSVSGGNVVITFTTTATADTAANFKVQTNPALVQVGNVWTDAVGANITGGSGTFTATLPVSGTSLFYRISR
jgi:hypothetical protein